MSCLKMIAVCAIFFLPILAKMVDGRQIFLEKNLYDDVEVRQTETTSGTKTEMKDESHEIGGILDTQAGRKVTTKRVLNPESSILGEKNYYTDEFSYPLNVDIVPLVRSLRSGMSVEELSIRPINAFDFALLKNPQTKCQGTKGFPQMLFLVKTALRNFERRSIIRETWGKEGKLSDVMVRTVFLLGKSEKDIFQARLDEEDAKYGDIVQSNFLDTYNNLTFKTMSGLKWAVDHCSLTSYFAFADDDMFISTKNLLRFLRNPSSYPDDEIQATGSGTVGDEIRLYAGHVNNNTSPKRNSSSKFNLPIPEYAFNRYPPYAAGGAYVLSRSTLLDLYYGSIFTKRIFIEDAFLGIVAKKVKINPIHCPEFDVHRKTPYSSPASYRNIIASHGYDDPEELKLVWNQQNRSGFA